MSSDFVHPSALPSQARAELELLDCLLTADATSYPWNPANPEAQAYFAALEEEVAQSWGTDDFSPYIDQLSAQLDAVWDAYPTSVAALFPAAVEQRLLAQLPATLLDGLVQQAQGAIAQANTLADQLVLAVQSFFPTWDPSDLQVLARPYAYAMRDVAEVDPLEGALQSLPSEDWDSLSEIEQARLSLAIARYIISQHSQIQL